MAALCPGVQYGLSSQGNFGDNKDLIFVKLTDSAYRAIEEYIRNQNKFSQNPTIQFLGNEGQLSFPSDHGSNGNASFNFSVSSTADMEGPGGSFECVQQCGPPRGALEGLGAMSHKMRIHANDDVYETTRHRMTVAEENHKNKCTREIKPNQTNIGRKIKKATPSRSIPIPKREPLTSVRESISSLSSSKPSYQSSVVSSKPTVHSSNGLGNGLGSNHVTSSRPQNKPSREAEILRRPIKERLIHLLALRPFKKPELIERINRDGREKNVLTTILKQIAFMQGNTYHLHQHMWSDVNDDWPYYTEQERQLLKRRKPQNLTPPGSSDGGSSGSGQSPTSTHPGSPPPPVTSSVKRPGYYDGADGLPTKRPRISHYRKPEPSYIRPAESNTQRRPPTDSRDASNMNPRSRESSGGGGGDRGGGGPGGGGNITTLNGGYAGTNTNGNSYTSSSSTIINNDKRHYSDEENDIANRKRACDSHSLSYNVNREKTFKENSICSSPNKTPTSQDAESRNSSNKDLWGDRTAAAAVVNRCRPVENDSRDRDTSSSGSSRGERERTGGGAAERDRGEKERGDRERERGEKERSDRERERGEKERCDRERERGEKERCDRERERGEKERSDRERERGEKERSDRERERSEKERCERERERERGEKERSDRERERGEKERCDRERGERERGDRERGERERGERERGGLDRDRERGDRNASDRDRGLMDRSDKDRMRWNKVSSTTHNGTSVTRVSPDSQADRIMTADSGPPPTVEAKSEFPDYLTEYTTIKNVEQRRRYKSDFNADYAEYRDLHAVVERVSRRFAQLEERLKQEDQASQGYKEIKKQIVRDYKENQRDSEYQKAKRRFQYLHDKLSHIKRLVLEYDQSTEAQGNHCDRY